jgi:hypothetical protein
LLIIYYYLLIGVFALSAELAAEASDDRRKSMSFTPGGSTVDPLENDKFAVCSFSIFYLQK